MNEQAQQEVTLESLKAFAYDQIAIKEQAERNLKAVNEEIAKRLQAMQGTPISEEVTEAVANEGSTEEPVKEETESK